ncbi:MAG TPA: Ig-like domain-containing protein, partial [Pirellulales bacterium]|nr:Ig-like domain-containing protein [Pirellulales bacterium]
MTRLTRGGQKSKALPLFAPLLSRLTNTRQSKERRAPRSRHAGRKARIQMLERRTVLDSLSWINAGSGNWDVAANWLDSTSNTHRVPGSGDTVTISTTAASTISIQSGDSESVASLSTATGDTLAITGGGQLTVSGDYTQDSGSALDFPLDGTRAGLDYGVLAVQGAATLDGQINMMLAAGYTPGADDSFQPLVYASESGTPTISVPSGEADFLTQTSLYVVPAGSGSLAVTSTADSGSGSLRDAIDQANASADPVELISFAIATSDPGYNAAAGVWTILPAAALPAVTAHAIIDGTTQPGYVGKPAIQLSGAGAGSGVDGLDVNGGHGRITGLAINGFNGNAINVSGAGFDTLTANFLGTDPTGTIAAPNNQNGLLIQNGAANDTIGGTTAGAANVISGNGANGVDIVGFGTSGNLLEGNFIGANRGGAAALANGGNGLQIVNGAANNIIGGTAVGAGNVISGNGSHSTSGSVYGGVFIAGSGTSGNLLEGNFIGANAAGTSVINNFGNGVAIQDGATNNIIGGTTAGAANVIGGNGYNGVNIVGSGTSGNLLEGNFIGTNAGGAAALANGGNGLQIVGGAANNTIGGTAVGAGNVISGNGSHSTANSAYGGVFIAGSGTSGNLLQGNFIGTNAGGTSVVDNFGDGVAIQDGATNNILGGTASGAGNVISGNGSSGVYIGGSETSGNLLEGNFIGTNAGGAAALANGDNGVEIDGATANSVGDHAAGAANTIAFNHNDAVLVDAGTGNLVSQNSIFSNGHLGIELTTNGNNNQAAPVLSSATSSGGTITVTGSLTSAPNTSFTLEFFANTVAGRSAVGEGQVFLGAKTVTTGASGAADFTVNLTVNLPANEQLLTATATDPTQDTSAFSKGVTITAAPFHLADDVYVIGSGTISVAAGSGVLANDTGPTQLTIAAGAVTGAEGGTFTFNSDGSFTYAPPANFPGFDYANYTVK